MKTLKFILFTILLAVAPLTKVYAQCDNPLKWTLSRTWSNGFKALPDVCTNLKEFQAQHNGMPCSNGWQAMICKPYLPEDIR